MKAWVVAEYGNPEWRQDAPEPPHAAGDVVVRVHASAANFADSLLLAGRYQERPRRPFVPGMELAGVVVDGGGTDWRPGQRVVGIARPGFGSWGELARCPANHLAALPDDVSATDGVALYINAQTSWFALHRRAQLRVTDVVLVHAAAGGVGSMAVQIARAHGCTVLGTSSSGKRGAVEALGIDRWYDNRDPAWWRDLRREHGSVDVVIDPVGQAVLADTWKLLAFEARYVTIGFASGDIPSLPLNLALVKNVALLGLYWTRYADAEPTAVAEAAEQIFELHRSGHLDPCVTRELPMSSAVDAVAEVASGATVGKTVLVPDW